MKQSLSLASQISGILTRLTHGMKKDMSVTSVTPGSYLAPADHAGRHRVFTPPILGMDTGHGMRESVREALRLGKKSSKMKELHMK